ncbi:PREDICTED: armadillo repeat-containing protein 2 [Elephantulus edwardii]|uniref:armadillo repeat-containing protein 2 n=1 Tax=Elephantulus edwardii TaxID=28737 RepID=UPI0003F06209|nr:PREDICTED: armadillo repeat-containing protein 2 [Elephantulus edwardii]
MLSPRDKKFEKLDPFYRPSMSKQKTSAEIISEARNALRTVRTQRPFTPQEEQRKLFGPTSSRTPENRPSSSFSLHSSSFESPDSRPISGTRLSPLELKPKPPTPPAADEHPCLAFPKPPVDPAKIRRISSSRARLFRAASQGTLLPDRALPPDETQKAGESKGTLLTGDGMVKRNGICLSESHAAGHLNSRPLQLNYDGGFGGIKEQQLFKGTTSLPSHLRNEGDQERRRARASSCPSCSELSQPETTEVSKAGSQEKDTEKEVNEVFWNTRIVPILCELEKEKNIETVCAACTQLHHALEEGNMLGNKFKRRNDLLKTLCKLVDVGSDLLSLKLAKLILAVKLLLGVLSSEDLQTNIEAFLYCVGTTKFLSGNPGFVNEMVSKGAVEIFLDLIRQLNENARKCGTCLPNSGHLLVQVTATLRNLADSPLVRSKLLSINALPKLCTVMEWYVGDQDVCTNISRIFSKLTSYHDCCAALANYSRCYALFLNLINKYQKKQDLVIRLVFILGNLTAKNNQAREQLFKEKGSIQTLLSLFQTFLELDLHSEKPAGDGEAQAKPPRQPSGVEDVLIKLTRVLANLAIHVRVGPALAARPQVVGLLLRTLESKSIEECEELVINATATINNLSYYQVKNSIIYDKKLYITELLLSLLVSKNMDGILEAVRALGNLSQHRDVCDFIVQKNVHKFMIALLDAKHQDICFSACGVLLNLTVDKDKRVVLKDGGGITKLVDCLKDFGPTDWQLACLVCKTLWNFSENITNASSCFGDEDTHTLLLVLSSFLDEELALDGSFDQDLRNYHKLHWETEFKPVAQQLLNRIQSHHTFLEPLPIPSF